MTPRRAATRGEPRRENHDGRVHRLARDLLLSESVTTNREDAPTTIATAQAWAALAIADALGRLATAVDALHQ